MFIERENGVWFKIKSFGLMSRDFFFLFINVDYEIYFMGIRGFWWFSEVICERD